MADKKIAEPTEFNVRDYLKLSFDLVNLKLASIDDKATKTEASVQGVIRTINQMQVIDAGHFSNCPNTIALTALSTKIDKEIQLLDVRLSEFEFLKKYWKIFAVSAAVTICGMLIIGYMAFAKIEETLINVKKDAKNKENGLLEEKLSVNDRTSTSTYIVH